MPYAPKDAEYLKSYPGNAMYEEIKEWILTKYNVKVSSLYVAQVKAKHGLEMRDCYNRPRSENIAVDNPAVELFLRHGFIEEYRTDDIIMLRKEL